MTKNINEIILESIEKGYQYKEGQKINLNQICFDLYMENKVGTQCDTQIKKIMKKEVSEGKLTIEFIVPEDDYYQLQGQYQLTKPKTYQHLKNILTKKLNIGEYDKIYIDRRQSRFDLEELYKIFIRMDKNSDISLIIFDDLNVDKEQKYWELDYLHAFVIKFSPILINYDIKNEKQKGVEIKAIFDTAPEKLIYLYIELKFDKNFKLSSDIQLVHYDELQYYLVDQFDGIFNEFNFNSENKYTNDLFSIDMKNKKIETKFIGD